MKELWTKDEASFSGKYIQFEKSWAWPKPIQKPHPPIIMGGAVGPKTAAHIAEFCDGWLPLGAHDVDTGLDRIKVACERIGRDPQEIELSMFYARTGRGSGDASDISAQIDKGARRVVLPLPSKGADTLLPLLDDYAKLMN